MSIIKHKHKQHSTLRVPLGDLLHKQGSKDTLSLSPMSFEQGFFLIHGVLTFTSISDHEVIISVGKLECSKSASCDYCGSVFTYTFHTLPEVVHAHSMNHRDEIGDYEFIYEIESDMNVDVYPILSNIILLYESVQYICNICEQKKPIDTDIGNSAIGSSISFITVHK